VWRRLLQVGFSVAYVIGVVFATLLLLKPGPPPRLPKALVVEQPLTKHLLFVIVDGLRYDVATDPERMPRFAEAMQRHRSGDMLAGPVSMTSSAVQAFATGQRGRIEQFARNLNPDPPPFESWMQNAHERGLKVALVGDPTWSEMFGSAFDEMRLDPPNAAVEVDFNVKTFADARATFAHAPDAFVLHFVTPDHQGHAYGVKSERYRKHIKSFDRMLFELLAELGPEWTVLVMSDHGANDAGDHGGDVLIHRRSPIFAYGPGIAPKGEPGPRLDQVDVPGTLAALLGVPAPCHSQGHLLVDWLDLDPQRRAKLALNDVERALTFARKLDEDGSAALAADLANIRRVGSNAPARQIAEARRLATASDELLRNQQGIFSRRAWWTLGGISVGAALFAACWLSPIGPGPALLALFLSALSVVLTAFVEKLPDIWLSATVVGLFVLFNLPTLLLLVRPERFLSWLRRCRTYAPALVPGGLAVTYPRNLQPVAFAVTLIVPLVILCSSSPERWGLSLPSRTARPVDMGWLALWGLLLLPAGWFPDGLPSLRLGQHPSLIVALGALAVVGVAVELVQRRPGRARAIALFCVAILASLALRRAAGPWLGRPALLLIPLLSLWLLARRELELGLLCLLCGYTWVSRDIELPIVVAALGLSLLVARRSAASFTADKPTARLLTLLGFWFALAFVLRLGVGGGIDPTHLDLAAGAFGETAAPTAWVGFCIVWKNLLAQTMVGVALLSGFPVRSASRLTRGFAVIGAGRAAVLLGMMLAAQGSFWTSMRVIGELPYTMIAVASAGAVWLLHHLLTRTAVTASLDRRTA
jgi:hypothetical protein